ncbi:MAG: amidohydrolase [Phenylobacterium zucineum]|nr:MAG: amidohydrolase [Phenylobacterium zucineum]
MSLLLRNVEVDGRAGQDVRIDAGRVVAISAGLARGDEEIDGAGGALIPGLADHHIHLLALAAKRASVDLSETRSPADLAARIAVACAARPAGAWVRATGWHEALSGDLTRASLDAIAPRHPLRVQHQTGALWVLNSAALAALGQGADPPGLDRETGRLLREDAWLRQRLPDDPPALTRLGAELAACGITHLTDASVTTDASAAGLLAAARRAGDLPQRLTLMSGGPLAAPADGAFAVGPVKVLLDDHDLPDFDDFLERVAAARAQGRAVAVHCVTAAELALTLAVFETAGARRGDRIEHGGVIPPGAIDVLRRLDLTVVTQPAFVTARGDRYLSQVDPADQPDLWRCASLLAAGVAVAGSSDAPYASPDPWLGIVAAATRRTASGCSLGVGEAISPVRALALYLDEPAAPGRRARRVAVGDVADLCLLDAPLADVLVSSSRERVRLTLIDGQVAYAAAG